MGELAFAVVGMRPVPWSCNEWAWRGAVAAVARANRPSVPRPPTPSVSFSVRLEFRLTEANIGRPDLDNLAKPVLDTIFRPRYAQVKDLSLTGALFDIDDDRVFRLELEKRLVDSSNEEGVSVRITW